jgi:hypothetical protein
MTAAAYTAVLKVHVMHCPGTPLQSPDHGPWTLIRTDAPFKIDVFNVNFQDFLPLIAL